MSAHGSIAAQELCGNVTDMFSMDLVRVVGQSRREMSGNVGFAPGFDRGQPRIRTVLETVTWSMSEVLTVAFSVQVPAMGRVRELVPQ